MKTSHSSAIPAFYWVTTIIVAVAFLLSGVGNLLRVEHIMQDMAHLGYPSYFPGLLGSWKVLGAVAILIPGFSVLKEWAYAGMMFDLTGAAFSRAAAGDSAIMILIPLGIAGLVVASRALYPARLISH
uniref:DoxX family protein n=1 Tax=Roseihalotalea indica TaxID=2867963 RepID=A0AA49JEN3_9BACT|nr:DoxX family protein [Tunicatimonas sp. TK19036]